ncbi:putative porin [Telmatospirillum siberiense]|uniref:Porin n=1 Tax=Telmatospirillum siberiense TaxID=382514 RepID=A0A2N3PLR2_9PROT|nr:putative porin [Telmatospirillum siberiense]PKU21340.1 hypothetical protein CWS72_27260 [Telmatospirillum siberiense]
MLQVNHSTRRAMALAVSLLALSAAAPALAADAPPSTPSLLEAMVASGVITQAQADKILADARARDAAKAAQGAAPQTAAQPAPANDGAVHVQYVPEVVKKQLREEIKSQVMAQARDEGWAAPNQTPEWTQRIKITGDMRVRGEEDMFPKGNTKGDGSQINWASINARSTPLDVASLTNSTNGATSTNAVPYSNWNQQRERMRLRARVGVEADLGEGFTTGVRLATGESSSPVSTNQTLGGSSGEFSKYQIWMDQAYIRYEPANTGIWGMSTTAGRFANPFFSTDLIWNNDLNFDGVAVSGKYQLAEGVTPFFTVGAFSVYNTDFNFSTYSSEKTTSQDKWLYAAQGGTDWKPAKDTAVKLGAAFYYFNNIEGKATSCAYDDITCGSDLFRPTFAQRGNTYMGLRNNNYSTYTSGTAYNYQYFGLATPFHELALTGKVDYDGLKPIFRDQAFRLTLDGEFVKNLSFNKSAINAKDCDTSGHCWNNDANGQFNGGDTGAMLRVTVGTPKLANRWDWNFSVGYKYIESDAVVDAFNDSDFGLGGTNLKGYVLGGNLALARNVWTSLKWMSADSIAGGTYASDVLLLDLNAKF